MYTQKIILKLPQALAIEVEARAQKYYAKLQESRKQSTKPPISQIDWVSKTPEGKQFMQECMTHKYSKLTQRELNALMKTKYYETYGYAPRKPGRPRMDNQVTYQDARSAMLVEILNEYYGIDAHASPIKLVVNNS